jgi:hypothetical protein
MLIWPYGSSLCSNARASLRVALSEAQLRSVSAGTRSLEKILGCVLMMGGENSPVESKTSCFTLLLTW